MKGVRIVQESPAENAFTLTEVVIVLAVVSALLMIAVPQVNGLLNSYRLSGAAKLVIGDLQNARMSAIQQNRSIQINFSSSAYTFVQVDTNAAIFSRDLTGDYPGISLSSSGSLTLAPTGMTTASTVTVTGSAGSKTITVAPTGRMLLN